MVQETLLPEGTRGSLIDFPLTWEARGLDINGKNY